ncbi:galactose-specific lectin nattectin-like [Triplophysa dalaica]|uniref:galactose-specific lectin nattectin-like n=1 Tax=Triplophysa dalaica TaxID=1582913 RepID=UPI0024E021FA|nr:galactose-specific lectin nattectin-like [Triplophysa dalaica]XP_056615223.1 galactose-specific lectin nattectin-like [Triplophysa dalaica]XP_056615224.1 galactose-specific lectin nattectin-like [Triplophysa dalaica]
MRFIMAVMRGLVLLFLVFSVENAAADDCPFGWTPFGVECFKLILQEVDWVGAEKNCQSLDGNLASVRSKAQNDFLLSLVPVNTNVWIGGHDAEMEEQWLWTDGSPFDYSNLCNGQPDNYKDSEHCLQINWSSNGCWNDNQCGIEQGYVCARNP